MDFLKNLARISKASCTSITSITSLTTVSATTITSTTSITTTTNITSATSITGANSITRSQPPPGPPADLPEVQVSFWNAVIQAAIHVHASGQHLADSLGGRYLRC